MPPTRRRRHRTTSPIALLHSRPLQRTPKSTKKVAETEAVTVTPKAKRATK